MKPQPGREDIIDIHSHLGYDEEGVFRINNFFPEQKIKMKPARSLSIGMHPWQAEIYDSLHNDLELQAADEKVLFIGETGLDRFRDANYSMQEEVFRIHIRISESFGMPVIIHCVKAFEDLFRIRKEESAKGKWIIHGFNSSPEMAARLVKEGYYISIGERLISKTDKFKKILEQLPLSAIFLETDDGSMTIMEICEIVSAGYNISPGEMKEYLLGNYLNIIA